jgi:S1-C subfamily serine protease
MSQSTVDKTVTLTHGALGLMLLGALAIGLLSGGLAGGLLVAAGRARSGAAEAGLSVHPERAWLGVTYVALTPAVAERYGLKAQAGALVVAVAAGSPAERGGIAEGDVITSIDQRSTTESAGSGDAIVDVVRSRKPGDMLAITIQREGSEQSLEIVLGRQPQMRAPQESQSFMQRLYEYMMRRLGQQ